MPKHPETHSSPNPVSKLEGVGDSGTQKDDGDVVREHDEHLLPHDPTLGTERAGGVTTSVDGAALCPREAAQAPCGETKAGSVRGQLLTKPLTSASLM